METIHHLLHILDRVCMFLDQAKLVRASYSKIQIPVIEGIMSLQNLHLPDS